MNLKASKMLSIIVPCYNEEKNIPLIISEFKKIIISSDEEIEVILVNNGSTDNSKKVFKKAIPEKGGKIFVHNLVNNVGYGHGILSGLKLAKGDVLSWTHADLQTDPNDVLKALKEYRKINNENIVFKGKRKSRNFLDTFFTWGMQVYCTNILNKSFNDINAQPKLFSRDFYNKNFQNAPEDFSLDLFLLYRAKQINTIDVYFKPRVHGKAKGGGTIYGKLKLINRTFIYINKLKKEIDKKL